MKTLASVLILALALPLSAQAESLNCSLEIRNDREAILAISSSNILVGAPAGQAPELINAFAQDADQIVRKTMARVLFLIETNANGERFMGMYLSSRLTPKEPSLVVKTSLAPQGRTLLTTRIFSSDLHAVFTCQ